MELEGGGGVGGGVGVWVIAFLLASLTGDYLRHFVLSPLPDGVDVIPIWGEIMWNNNIMLDPKT